MATRRTMLDEWAADDGCPWTFGDPRLDCLLPGGGLDRTGLHEIKPQAYGDWPAAVLLALRLAVRRVSGAARGPPDVACIRPGETAVGGPIAAPGHGRRHPATVAGAADPPPPRILWCQTSGRAGDIGRLYPPGLATLGLTPEAVLEVEVGRAGDVLWAMEEGLASGALALVVGGVDTVALTPSRRLGLAASAGRTPCLLLSAPGADPAPSATTRWRVGRAASGNHPFDPTAPGAPRLALSLERCRGTPLLADGTTMIVEWCDGTRGFRVAADLADRLPRTGHTRRHAG